MELAFHFVSTHTGSTLQLVNHTSFFTAEKKHKKAWVKTYYHTFEHLLNMYKGDV